MGESVKGHLMRNAAALRNLLRPLKYQIEQAIHRPRSEAELVSEAEAYWRGDADILPQHSHWRGAGIFDDERWGRLGKRHVALYERLTKLAERPERVGTIVEWGCGGGANAVHFAPYCSTFVGVDISKSSLDECGRQLQALDFSGYVPIEIDVASPESALRALPAPADFFLCTYVFELLPSADYGLRLLELAHRMLAANGMALIQIRCSDGTWQTKPRRFDYRRNVSRMVTYPLEKFWSEAERIGFEPLAASLLPEDNLTGDDHYAFVMMVKVPPSADEGLGPDCTSGLPHDGGSARRVT